MLNVDKAQPVATTSVTPKASSTSVASPAAGPVMQRGQPITDDIRLRRDPFAFRLTRSGAQPSVRLFGHTLVTGNASMTPEEAKVAGTIYAPAPTGRRMVEGPHFLHPAAVRPHVGAFKRFVQEMVIRLTFGTARRGLNVVRVFTSPSFTFTPLKGAEVVRMVEEWRLKPGDWLVVGTSVHSHLMMYAGKNAQGRDEIVHAMATEKTYKSVAQTAVMAAGFLGIKAFGAELPHVGVVREDLAGFFDRYPRGVVTAMRDPRLTQSMRERGMAHLDPLVGKKYNYSLAPLSEGRYCSELMGEFVAEAYRGSGLPLPWLGTVRIKAGPPGAQLDQFVFQPNNAVVSPDFEIVGTNSLKACKIDFENIVVGKPTGGAFVAPLDGAP